MVEIVVSVAAKVSEYLVDPVVRQLRYLFNYRANIEALSQKVEKLKDTRVRQQHSVDEAIRNGHKIEHDVCKWLTRADGFLQDACDFLEFEKEARKSCLNGLRCPNLKSRYRLSRAARKKAGVAAQIHGDAQFERVSYRPPLPEIRSTSSEALPLRLVALNEVMKALREENINRIGVWGLGGVGKSTLAKQVAEQAAQEKLFDQVVTASVLQTPDFKRIQGELVDKLDMKFEEESEKGRAARLYQRMKEEKTILVVLDDLWTEVDLEKIGIPSPDDHKGCKLLLTSRNTDVLANQMGTQKDFRVEHLQEDEAWILFKNRADDSIENPDLESVAMDIAKECAGLPLAIVTLAKALKNKRLSIWKDALQQLKTQTSTNISGMETKVYSSLKFSYDYLEGDEVKSLFLLCGLFSNYIHLRDLLKYGVGLRLFQGTNTLEEAKNRIDALVDNLKASNLLLETGHNAAVRMHDVVRSTARKIASREHHVFTLQRTTVREEEWPRMDELKKITWASLNDCDIHELPEGLVCPNLEFFGCFPNNNLSVKIPDSFFEGMKQLKVLDFTRLQLTSLPPSFCCLTNLGTLCFDECKLGDIVMIEKLKKLKILSLMYSDIEELPREIAELTHLRLLDLKGSSKLKVIPADVILGLARLENLCMENSFTQWEMGGKNNACLAELNHLTLLTSLDIQIPDAKLLPKDIVFENLERYKILVGDVWRWESYFDTNRTLKLNKFDTGLHLVNGISKLLKKTEDLHLRELCGDTNSLSKLDGDGFLKLKYLSVETSPEIQYIVNSRDLTPSHGAFPVMETLSLNHLVNLQELCNGQLPTGSFGRLKKVEVEGCDGLKYLFSLSVARCLFRLEEIRVSRCKTMDEMVSQGLEEIKEDGDDTANVPLFPELKYLTLGDLPKLRHVCNSYSSTNDHLSSSIASAPVGTIIFPKLIRISLESLPALTSFSSGYRSMQRLHHADLVTPFPVLFDGRASFPYLEELTLDHNKDTKIWQEQCSVNSFPRLRVLDVSGYGDILVVIPSFMLQGLHNLEELNVDECSLVNEVIQLEGLNEESQAKWLVRLRRIWLCDLPRLTHLWKENIQPGPHLQSLERLQVCNCESLIQLLPSSASFQNLATLDVWSCDSLRSLISPSVAKSLVKLKTLQIGESHMMEEVVANEGGGATDEITFCKLQHMELLDLPNLTSFSSGGCILSFPSLEHILVRKCPIMKIFSSGLLNTPKLERVKVGDSEWHWQEDLNTTIKSLFINTHGMR